MNRPLSCLYVLCPDTHEVKEFSYRSAGDRITKLRRDFRERFQNETPRPKLPVRDDQSRLIDLLIAEEHQIEIECPRRVRKGPFTASLALDCHQRFKQLARVQRRLADRGAVQKWRLLVRYIDRFGFVPRRDSKIGEETAEA